MMTTLYNLTQEYQKLLDKDEYDETDMEAIDATHHSIEDKVVGYACVIKELEGRKQATEDAINIAKYKSDRIQNKIDYLRSRALESLTVCGIEKIDKHPLFDIKVKTNKISVDDYDKDSIPKEYWRKNETFSLDKTKIKEDIENLGLVIPGARLIRKKVLKIE